ncbi:hypothetical protein SH1V18_38900 [Vallitalea longa]|uniref:Uncharacterized protein n=1 Tax=Vallitalea longa TaxID=2936439 RepID=A0A9W6DGA1_9FIRM|nr:hypothetical protein [Vallitalea longa]GKX31410.1 hypothetical protein SH1V18_38900 [Vallitalea longa]
MTSSVKRSLTGILYNLLMDFKTNAKIGIIISFAIGILINGTLFTHLNTNNEVYQCTNIGFLQQGFIFMTVVFSIGIFISCSKQVFNRKFVFPLNRKIYALGNFFFIVIGSYIAMIIICALEIIEFVFSMICSSVTKVYYFIPTVSPKSFLSGFIILFSLMACIVSLVYLISVFFYKFKITTCIIISILIFGYFNITSINVFFINISTFYFNDTSVLFILIKFWISTIVFQLIAYTPIKFREVEK